ncbi:hypothetical protein [Halopseudomonas salina]|uniref:Uncharacterized protein n=1 Tax=Halopseudomonas salina TaxID=1323744 RepID=A0ABQ1P1H8_9GAMM|nr:hypothetical protein [Halopseudomonas salina]GGC87557.1 hypothetical protein GCM10007418_04140 [Halopseudomonas salina]
MIFKKATTMSTGMDQDAKIDRGLQSGDRVFVESDEHQGQIQITLKSQSGATWAGRVSGYYPPLDASAEPQDCEWDSLQDVEKDQVIHHEYGG